MKNGLCLYQHQVQRLNVCKLVQIDNECILFGQVLLVLILFDEGLVGLLLHHMLKARCVSYNFRYFIKMCYLKGCYILNIGQQGLTHGSDK